MANISVTASTHPLHKDIYLISVKGFIDTTTAPEFERTFQTLLGEKKFNLIIDLKEVNYVSSAGWGIFVGEIKRIRGQKGNLFLVAMGPEVAEVFELLEFDTILKAFPTVEQAVQTGFGRAKGGKPAEPLPVVKAARKSKSAKAEEPVPAAEGPTGPEASRNPGLVLSFEEPEGKDFKKPHWIARMFLPWKWF